MAVTHVDFDSAAVIEQVCPTANSTIDADSIDNRSMCSSSTSALMDIGAGTSSAPDNNECRKCDEILSKMEMTNQVKLLESPVGKPSILIGSQASKIMQLEKKIDQRQKWVTTSYQGKCKRFIPFSLLIPILTNNAK